MGKQSWKPGNMIYPLPAVMVSAGNAEGQTNILTIAWTGTICTNPAMLYISVRPERYSYSNDQRIRRVCRQSYYRGIGKSDGLLWRAFRQRCG